MKITRNNTVLDLKPESEVPLTLSNPMFNDTGSFSYPFETPATPAVLAALGFPNRADRYNRYVNKAPATLQHGLLQLSGTHNVSSIDPQSGTITNDFIADEGAFYEEIGGRMLSAVMQTKVIPPDTQLDDNAKYSWLRNRLELANQSVTDPAKTLSYDFCTFPCCIGTEALDGGGTNYIFLNKTDQNGNIIFGITSLIPFSLNPDGVTPFLFVRTIIREIFEYYNFTILANPFTEIRELQLAAVLNNTIDALVPGFIDYADLVPTVTVNTFLKTVEAQFGCKFFIDYRLRTVHILQLDFIFNTAPVKDFTAKLSSPVSLGYDDPQKLILTVGKSFSRSVTIGDSQEQIMEETLPGKKSLNIEDALYTASEFVRNVVFAYNRNNFYITELDHEIEDWDRFRYKLICSPFFDYRGYGNLQEYVVENDAEAVNIICARDDSTAWQHIDVPSFEAGTRRLHPTTTKDNIPLVDGYGNRDCPLSFVIVRGWVTANYTYNQVYEPKPNIRYLFASSFTTHPVAGSGIEGQGRYHSINLNPTAIRELWYKGFEDFLRRSNVSASCSIALDGVDINNIRWWEKIWLKGQPYFIDKINITLTGDSDIRVDSVDLRTARLFGGSSVSYVFSATPTTIDAPAAGGEYFIDIISTADGEWTEYSTSRSATWIGLVHAGSSRMQVTVEPNDTGKERAGEVILRQTNTSMPDIVITVNQSA
jgi:hypothetical protein